MKLNEDVLQKRRGVVFALLKTCLCAPTQTLLFTEGQRGISEEFLSDVCIETMDEIKRRCVYKHTENLYYLNIMCGCVCSAPIVLRKIYLNMVA